MKHKFLSILIFVLSSPVAMNNLEAQECVIPNEQFIPGEKVVYEIYYNWGFIWVNAGEATFSVDLGTYLAKPAYHFTGYGTTYPKYDWFYKVRDTYESWADTASLMPHRFVRNVFEGGNSYYSECKFQDNKTVCSVSVDKKGKVKKDTISVSSCAFDPVTMVYYARLLNFDLYEPRDTIPLTIVLDDEVYDIYLRYLGTETLEMDSLGTYETYKFKALLIEGTLFKSGENMTVWVSKDNNRIPLRIESEILVGSIITYAKKIEGLRHPLTSKVK